MFWASTITWSVSAEWQWEMSTDSQAQLWTAHFSSIDLSTAQMSLLLTLCVCCLRLRPAGCCWCGCRLMDLSKRVSLWTVQDVLEWVQEQCPAHVDTLQKAIIKHSISGTTHEHQSIWFRCSDSAPVSLWFTLFTPDTLCVCEWICRPSVAEVKGASPGASRGGGRGAAAGDPAGPPPPPSSGGNQWTQWHLLRWGRRAANWGQSSLKEW